MKKLNNRGVSMAECMIAMAIVVAVSAAAVSTITHFSKISAKMMIRNNAVTMAESTLECFKFAENYYEFNRSLYIIQDQEYDRKVYEETKDEETGEYTYQYAYYMMQAYGYSVVLRVTYDYNNGTARIDINASDENFEELYSIDNFAKAVRSP